VRSVIKIEGASALIKIEAKIFISYAQARGYALPNIFPL
jgi:hypothetical protein